MVPLPYARERAFVCGPHHCSWCFDLLAELWGEKASGGHPCPGSVSGAGGSVQGEGGRGGIAPGGPVVLVDVVPVRQARLASRYWPLCMMPASKYRYSVFRFSADTSC